MSPWGCLTFSVNLRPRALIHTILRVSLFLLDLPTSYTAVLELLPTLCFVHASISSHLISYAVLPHSTVFFLSLIIFLIDACGWGCRIGFIHHIIPPTNHRVTTVSVPNIIPLLRAKVMTERDYLYDVRTVLDTPLRWRINCDATMYSTVLRTTRRLSCHLPVFHLMFFRY